MTDTPNLGVSEADMKKKEIPVVYDQGVFLFDTGDTYDGNFEARKKDRSARMHGLGTYTTAEGDVYYGQWDSDKLIGNQEDVEIRYSDGAKYKGKFKDWCYTSRGSYTYTDESELTCDFQDNAPIGKLQLRDPNGHIWLGKTAYGYGWVSPSNHFYDVLEATRDLSKTKKRKKQGPNSESTKTVSLDSASAASKKKN